MAALADRISDKLMQSSSGCWIFTGRCNEYGYGLLDVNGTPRRVHRLVWEIEFGPIPNDLLVCHSCDNPKCCNPSHLFLGTHQDNSDDKWRKGRAVHTGDHCRGELNCNAILNEDSIKQIRELLLMGYTHSDIGDAFGVSRYTITDINRGKSWSWL